MQSLSPPDQRVRTGAKRPIDFRKPERIELAWSERERSDRLTFRKPERIELAWSERERSDRLTFANLNGSNWRGQNGSEATD